MKTTVPNLTSDDAMDFNAVVSSVTTSFEWTRPKDYGDDLPNGEEIRDGEIILGWFNTNGIFYVSTLKFVEYLDIPIPVETVYHVQNDSMGQTWFPIHAGELSTDAFQRAKEYERNKVAAHRKMHNLTDAKALETCEFCLGERIPF